MASELGKAEGGISACVVRVRCWVSDPGAVAPAAAWVISHRNGAQRGISALSPHAPSPSLVSAAAIVHLLVLRHGCSHGAGQPNKLLAKIQSTPMAFTSAYMNHPCCFSWLFLQGPECPAPWSMGKINFILSPRKGVGDRDLETIRTL